MVSESKDLKRALADLASWRKDAKTWQTANRELIADNERLQGDLAEVCSDRDAWQQAAKGYQEERDVAFDAVARAEAGWAEARRERDAARAECKRVQDGWTAALTDAEEAWAEVARLEDKIPLATPRHPRAAEGNATSRPASAGGRVESPRPGSIRSGPRGCGNSRVGAGRGHTPGRLGSMSTSVEFHDVPVGLKSRCPGCGEDWIEVYDRKSDVSGKWLRHVTASEHRRCYECKTDGRILNPPREIFYDRPTESHHYKLPDDWQELAHQERDDDESELWERNNDES